MLRLSFCLVLGMALVSPMTPAFGLSIQSDPETATPGSGVCGSDKDCPLQTKSETACIGESYCSNGSGSWRYKQPLVGCLFLPGYSSETVDSIQEACDAAEGLASGPDGVKTCPLHCDSASPSCGEPTQTGDPPNCCSVHCTRACSSGGNDDSDGDGGDGEDGDDDDGSQNSCSTQQISEGVH